MKPLPFLTALIALFVFSGCNPAAKLISIPGAELSQETVEVYWVKSHEWKTGIYPLENSVLGNWNSCSCPSAIAGDEDLKNLKELETLGTITFLGKFPLQQTYCNYRDEGDVPMHVLKLSVNGKTYTAALDENSKIGNAVYLSYICGNRFWDDRPSVSRAERGILKHVEERLTYALWLRNGVVSHPRGCYQPLE